MGLSLLTPSLNKGLGIKKKKNYQVDSVIKLHNVRKWKDVVKILLIKCEIM